MQIDIEICEGIIPWYQEEVYGLAKSMSNEMDSMIIALPQGDKNEM